MEHTTTRSALAELEQLLCDAQEVLARHPAAPILRQTISELKDRRRALIRQLQEERSPSLSP